MRAVITVIVLFAISNAFADENQIQDHGIRRPVKKEEGIRRTAPKSEEVGLNGKLIWVNDFLVLETPSGKKYSLKTPDKTIESKLVSLSEDGQNTVELEGKLSEGKLTVKGIESSGKGTSGEFIVSFKDGLSERQLALVQSSMKEIAGVRVLPGLNGTPFVTVETDFSKSQLETLLSENSATKGSIESVIRNITLPIKVDLKD